MSCGCTSLFTFSYLPIGYIYIYMCMYVYTCAHMCIYAYINADLVLEALQGVRFWGRFGAKTLASFGAPTLTQ